MKFFCNWTNNHQQCYADVSDVNQSILHEICDWGCENQAHLHKLHKLKEGTFLVPVSDKHIL